MSTTYNIVLQGASLLATANATTNVNLVDVLGNKADVANRTASQASVVGLLRQLDADLTLVAGALGATSTITGVADNGTTTTLVDATLTQADDYFNGMVLIMTSGNNVGLARTIYDFVAGTDTVYVEPAFPSAIAITDTYTILPRSNFADILLGHNNADNAADTTLVIANADGSILERIEYVQTAVDTTIPALIGTPLVDLATDLASINTLIGTPVVNVSTDIAAIQTVVDNIEDLLDGTTATAIALRREIGKMQVFEKGITGASNAGLVVLGTVTTRPVILKSVTLYSQGATSGDLTSAAIKGGTAQATIFITDVQAAKANIDADSEQVYTLGAWYLPAGATVVVDLQGTGATAVDLVAVFTYEAVLDGGYIA